jgi:glutamate racemase
MAIGVFDSGIGGLTIYRSLSDRFPYADLIYFADQRHAPYGVRDGEDIVRLTKAGCQKLFDEGCNLVVLACNTASAIALSRLQHDWLPAYRRQTGRALNILGIIVPTIEAATGLLWSHRPYGVSHDKNNTETLGVFCTTATANSRVYDIEIEKRRPDVRVFSEPCPELAGLIERNAPLAELKTYISLHVGQLLAKTGVAPDRAILGCTHYEVVSALFEAALPAGTKLIRQPQAVAEALSRYLASHPEYTTSAGGRRLFLSTSTLDAPHNLAEGVWGSPLKFVAA